MDADPPDHAPDAPDALEALRRVVREIGVGHAVHSEAETALLQSVVDAAVVLFEAEAASIALFEREPDRLEYRVAAGAQGSGVVGLSVPPTQGVAGYVFSTGQPLSLSDVASDPRFDRGTAARTGYVPRSIAAVPLVDKSEPVGVLQVLDKHTSPTFTLRDMELLAVFARQAAAGIEATRLSHDSVRLLRAILAETARGELSDEQLDELIAATAAELDHDDETPFWQLVHRVARIRQMPDVDLELVGEILEVVARRRAIVRGGQRRRSMTGGRIDR
jgi:GAF domain-containing protein